mmetsp:Transcript_54624/g.118105  ORF Transcript_54624/g.118105 Transcript_54624/m.118105 type:complete len:90 (+) Transcript_54624:365-634(+)
MRNGIQVCSICGAAIRLVAAVSFFAGWQCNCPVNISIYDTCGPAGHVAAASSHKTGYSMSGLSVQGSVSRPGLLYRTSRRASIGTGINI